MLGSQLHGQGLCNHEQWILLRHDRRRLRPQCRLRSLRANGMDLPDQYVRRWFELRKEHLSERHFQALRFIQRQLRGHLDLPQLRLR